MPVYRSMKKRNYKRKRNYYRNKRHNRRNYKNKALITQVKGQGISDMMYVKLIYAEQIPINPSVVSYFPYVFRGNSLFDPNLTGTGHQPLYFDQYSAIYSKYRVLGSSVKLDVINNGAVSAMFYVCEPNTDQSSIVDLAALYEQARSGAPKIVPIAARVSSRMKKYASTRKVCGLTKSQLYDDTFAAGISSSPSNTWYWNLLFGSVDNSSVPSGYFVIKMTFYVQFFDRVLTSQS